MTFPSIYVPFFPIPFAKWVRVATSDVRTGQFHFYPFPIKLIKEYDHIEGVQPQTAFPFKSIDSSINLKISLTPSQTNHPLLWFYTSKNTLLKLPAT